MELRASYFSCHTDNNVRTQDGNPDSEVGCRFPSDTDFTILFQDDEVFTLNVNLIVMREGNEVRYALTRPVLLLYPGPPERLPVRQTIWK